VDLPVWLQGNEAAVSARIFIEQGELKNARERLAEATAFFTEAGDRRQVIACLGGTGEVAAREGRLQDALRIFERTRAEARSNAQADLEAISLRNAGAIYALLGDRETAQLYEQRAATVFPETENEKEQRDQADPGASRRAPAVPASEQPSQSQQDIPADDTSGSNVERILATLDSRLNELSQAAPNPSLKLLAHSMKGDSFRTKGQHDAACQAYTEALNYAAAIPAPDLDETHDAQLFVAATLGRAESRIALGQLEGALADTEDVFGRILRPTREPRKSGHDAPAVWQKEYFYIRCCNLAGEALLRLGRVEEAEANMQEALDICFDWKGVGIPKPAFIDLVNTTGFCAFSFGKLLIDTGRPEFAQEKLRMSLSAFEVTGNIIGQAASNLDMANALAAVEEREPAGVMAGGRVASAPSADVMRHFEAAKSLYAEIGFRPGLAAVCGATALFLLRNGWPAQAWSWLQDAAKLHAELGMVDELVQDRINEGNACRKLELLDQAREAFENAYEIASEHGLTDSEWLAAAGLGDLELSLDEIKAARKHFEAAVAAIEAQRALLLTEPRKINFFITKEHVYKRLIQVLLAQDRKDLAFLAVERSRSRALLDLMRDTALQTPSGIPAELLMKESKLIEASQIAARALHGVGVGTADRRAMYLRAKETRTSIDQLLDEIASVAPEYSSLRRGDPASFDDAARLIQSDRRIILVEYFVTDETVHVFGVASDATQPELVTLPLDSTELRRFIRTSFAGHGKVRELVADGLEELWHAYDYLVQPVVRWAKPGDTVYLIPHGLLHYLPLHALMVGDRYLIDRNPVAYAPSASVLKFCRAKRKPRPQAMSTPAVVIFGDSREDLPMARREAEGLAGLFGTRPFLGYEVDRETVRAAIPPAEIIHFAGHGYFDAGDPLNSGLKLANDQILTARDVFNLALALQAHLVTLSGCETGINEQAPGDELLGLVRAFLFAGATCLLVSMWRVDDESTAFLMSSFYRLLYRSESRPATVDALQQAICETKSRYPTIDRWAPFMMIGDWA
jgi:CHAT domain-containing protein